MAQQCRQEECKDRSRTLGKLCWPFQTDPIHGPGRFTYNEYLIIVSRMNVVDPVGTEKHLNCHRHQFPESRRKRSICVCPSTEEGHLYRSYFDTDACAQGVFQLYCNV